MSYDRARRELIFSRTNGRCHICGKKLCFNNYGIVGARGAWHVDHSRARALGGSDCLNNLYAACIRCNLAKGICTSRTARTWNDRTKAPLSSEGKDQLRRNNGVVGGVIGAVAGAVIAGPFGAAIGGGLGVAFGKSVKVDE